MTFHAKNTKNSTMLDPDLLHGTSGVLQEFTRKRGGLDRAELKDLMDLDRDCTTNHKSYYTNPYNFMGKWIYSVLPQLTLGKDG